MVFRKSQPLVSTSAPSHCACLNQTLSSSSLRHSAFFFFGWKYKSSMNMTRDGLSRLLLRHNPFFAKIYSSDCTSSTGIMKVTPKFWRSNKTMCSDVYIFCQGDCTLLISLFWRRLTPFVVVVVSNIYVSNVYYRHFLKSSELTASRF